MKATKEKNTTKRTKVDIEALIAAKKSAVTEAIDFLSDDKVKLNYSRAKAVITHFYGPLARIWHTNRPTVEVGLQASHSRTILATAPDFKTAVIEALKLQEKNNGTA